MNAWRSVLQPRVARHALPWVPVPPTRINPNGVAPRTMCDSPVRTEPRCGSVFPAPIPRVGLIAFGQPWAGGRNAVGVFFTVSG